MGKTGAYLVHGRVGHGVRPGAEAVRDYEEFILPLSREDQETQASRCMNCGVAFCQSGIAFVGARRASGCPLHNMIPETNDLLCQGRLDDAAQRLSLTNPLPEFTSRVCPAPCETACNLGLHQEAVTIHDNERAISDYAWEQGIEPLCAAAADAPLVTVVGSGPAGLAAAWELARRGKRVRVVERADRPGGLLMYGIPNMKLPKDVITRRVELMERSGIEFCCGVDAVQDAKKIIAESDAVVIAAGAREARRMDIPGVELSGVHYALEYLEDSTRSLLDGGKPQLDAKGLDVVVIGGGDTGVDCVATALRQGAKSVRQVIRAQCPPDQVDVFATWPRSRNVASEGYGQREAREVLGSDPRIWSTDTLAFVGEGAVSAVKTQELSYEGGRHGVEGSEAEIPAQLVLIAKGFVGAEQPLLKAFGVEEAGEGHLAAEVDGTPVYLAGDVRLGSTLVATAMADALACAAQI